MIKIALLLIILYLPFISVQALNFNEAGRLAVENSFELRNEIAALGLREGIWMWGIRAYIPRIGLMISQEDRLSITGPDSFLKNYSINIDQLVWDGGRLSLSRRIERAELELANRRLVHMASEIAETAVSAYREILYGRMILDIHNNSIASLREQFRILELELDLGLVRPGDLAQAEITLAMYELDIISIILDLEHSERMFSHMLGLDNLPALHEEIDIFGSPQLPELDLALSIAESRNPDLEILRYSIARREAEVRAASFSWLPTIRLNGSFGISGRQFPLSRYNWSVGISIDFSSPWLSGNFGVSTGEDPPFDRNARYNQSLNPLPDPARSFSPQSAALALAEEQYIYETAHREMQASIERLLISIRLLDRRRILSMEVMELEKERYVLSELKLSLGEITRIELMELRLECARKEAAVVEAAVILLQALRELERILDMDYGEINLFSEVIQ